MEMLGAGVCFQFPPVLDRLEPRQQLLRGLLRDKAPELKKWIWTKAGFLGGELVFSHPAFDDKQNALR